MACGKNELWTGAEPVNHGDAHDLFDEMLPNKCERPLTEGFFGFVWEAFKGLEILILSG